VIGDFERPARRRAAQDRALARYLRTQVAPYSPLYGEALRGQPVDGIDGLAGGVALTRIDDLSPDEAGDLVLHPTGDRIASSGDRRLVLRLWWSRWTRRLGAFNRNVVEPVYKPVHWTLAGDRLPVGYSAADVDQLAEIGRHQLELAGVQPYDVLVGVLPPGPTVGFWQLSLGARLAGVASLFLAAAPAPSPEDVARVRPNVLAGRPSDLVALLEAGRASGLSFAGLHTLIAVGAPLDATMRTRLAELGGTASREAAVVAAWAPPGVRALWAECRDGADVHTWPAVEVLELVDPLTGEVSTRAEGEVVYTPLGWRGTVVLRLRTGVYASLDDAPCVACGRTSPRVRLVPFLPPFAVVLDEHPEVELWQAELRTVDGAEELIVFVTPRLRGAHPGRLLRELDRRLSVTQFVVLDRRTLAARLRKAGDSRVVDLRR
jgi:hypothetical protein